MAKDPLVIGVDVGTGSARAGVFDLKGRMLGVAAHPIEMWRPAPDFAEHCSEDIWRAVGAAVRGAMKQAKARPEAVEGLSFDATCSLVALDETGRPVSVSPTLRDEQNVVVWLDHRAKEETAFINRTKHPSLRYVGGAISIEMQPPKILWIKRNLARSWRRIARFYDLADYLTWRASGSDSRSLCTTVCKWTYLGHEGKGGRWPVDLFQQAGLLDLVDRKMIGDAVLPMGSPLGPITPSAAKDFGLTTTTTIGVGIIDAHAGGLGVLGMNKGGGPAAPRPADLEKNLALIGGTSSCHMAVSQRPRFIRGIWGPYYSAMVPGMWLTEGGQSATGALLDHVIEADPAGLAAKAEAKKKGQTIYDHLNRRAAELRRTDPELTRDFHVLPYFHGNRSPRADPGLRGVESGLSLDSSLDTLAVKYLATIQAIAYGTRHIVEEMNKAGYRIGAIHACGGGTKNPVWLQEHADVTGCEILLPECPEAVLLGSAMLAAVACGRHPSVIAAMGGMSASSSRLRPDPKTRAFHAKKYRVFHDLYESFMRWREVMA